MPRLSSTTTRATCFLLAGLASLPAFAHPGHPISASLSEGFLHPLSGADHLLVLLAVGIWAAQQRGRLAWAMPLLFPLVMAAGALAALAGFPLPVVESGIAVSVVILGLLVAFAVRLHAWAGVSAVSVFALFHGYAHGSEIAAGASVAMYIIGFAAASGLLHVCGMLTARFLQRRAARVVHAAGAGMAMAGMYLLAVG